MKNTINKKVYKECFRNLTMKKSGDLCSSLNISNQLSLKIHNNNSLCCNFKRVTRFSNSPKIIAMVKG